MNKIGLMLLGCVLWLWSWWPVFVGYQFDNGQGAMLGMIVRALYMVHASKQVQS